MSSHFLQRFKGKTQHIRKEGFNDILGLKKAQNLDTQIYPLEKSFLSAKNNQHQTIPDNQTPKKVSIVKLASIKRSSSSNQSPFLVSNPFYRDEEEQQRQEERKREELRLEEQKKKIQLIELNRREPGRFSKISRSLQKKMPENGWSKLGGLGANVGGYEWLEKKRKRQKMQEFSHQVKSINTQKIKLPSPHRKIEQIPEANSRQRMLEYSKNIPKPIIRRNDVERVERESKMSSGENQEGISELQIYEMKHQQLKKMLYNHHY